MSDNQTILEGGQTNDAALMLLHSPYETCSLNAEKYRKDMEGFDLTEEQAAALLQTLWSIMATFVELGFGVDSVQYLLQQAAPGHSGDTLILSNTESVAHEFNSTASDEQKKGTA